MEVKQKLATVPVIEGIPNQSQIAPFNSYEQLVNAGTYLGAMAYGAHSQPRYFFILSWLAY